MKLVKLFTIFSFLVLSNPSFSSSPTQASVEVGEQAPDFELQDSAGKTFKLSDFRGDKAVVLEFFRSGDW